jgi:hypothetical protein
LPRYLEKESRRAEVKSGEKGGVKRLNEGVKIREEMLNLNKGRGVGDEGEGREGPSQPEAIRVVPIDQAGEGIRAVAAEGLKVEAIRGSPIGLAANPQLLGKGRVKENEAGEGSHQKGKIFGKGIFQGELNGRFDKCAREGDPNPDPRGVLKFRISGAKRKRLKNRGTAPFRGPVESVVRVRDGKGGLKPQVNWQIVQATGRLLVEEGYVITKWLERLGCPAYLAGSEFKEVLPPEMLEEMGTPLAEEMLKGIKVPIDKEMMKEEPSVKEARLRKEASQGARGIRSEAARNAFMLNLEKGVNRGEIVLVPLDVALKIPGIQFSPVYLIEERKEGTRINQEGEVETVPAKWRKIQDLSDVIPTLGVSINEATVMSSAPAVTYGSTPRLFMRDAYNLLIPNEGKDLAATKRDVDGAFNRVHVDPEEAAIFAFVVSPKVVALQFRLVMGWTMSPSVMAKSTDGLAKLVMATKLKDVPSTRVELEEIHKESFQELGIGEVGFRGIADSQNPGLTLEDEVVARAFVDDLLVLLLRNDCEGVTRLLCWAFSEFYRPVDPRESHYRGDPAMSLKKLLSEGYFDGCLIALGIGIDLLRGEAFIPEPRREKLEALLKGSFGKGIRWASVKNVQRVVGQCCSLSQVKPQGSFAMSGLYGALRGLRGTTEAIHLSTDFLEELEKWRVWVQNPERVSLHNLVVRDPTFQGWSDAAGTKDGGMGGFWRLGNEKAIWWRARWPHDITDRLTRLLVCGTRVGDITINDLELAGVIVNFIIIRQKLGKEGFKFAVLECWADNVSAVSWVRDASQWR